MTQPVKPVSEGLGAVAWTNDSALALLREHWPLVAVLPTSYEQTPLYPIPLVTLSAASATIKGLEAEIERLTRERDAAIDRAKVWEFNWQHEVKVKGEVVSWVKGYQERLDAAEAERDALRKALEKISSPTQTTNLLWWQIEARKALSGSKE